MKRFTRLLGISVLFLGLAACESLPEESSGTPMWLRSERAASAPGRHHQRRFHAGPDLHQPGAPDLGLPVEDQLATRGDGLRHRRHDGLRHDGRRHDGRRGDSDRRGPRDGMGPGRREDRRGMHRRGDGMKGGDGRRGEGRRKGPPAEALTACDNKAAGDACSFVLEGETVSSVCKARRNGDGPLACRAGKHTHRRHTTPAQ